LIALTNESGAPIERYAYDPWGARRNPDDWTQKDSRAKLITNRGYTMHEHLDAFGIINMNGRVYDPLTAQFLSPDPFVQSPDNWANYNRYGYCLNNPLIYSDPSGYLVTAAQLKEIRDGAWDGGIHSSAGAGVSGYGGGGGSGGHYEDITTSTFYLSYSINKKTEEIENYYFRYEYDVTRQWVWDSQEDRMYAAVHPEINFNTTYHYANSVVIGQHIPFHVPIHEKNPALNGVPIEFAVLLAAFAPEAVAASESATSEVTTINESSFTVTQEGVVLPKGAEIPTDYIENPYQSSNYGIFEDGKYVEKVRIDAGTPPGSKGPNISHFHLNDGKHIFDPTKWPWFY